MIDCDVDVRPGNFFICCCVVGAILFKLDVIIVIWIAFWHCAKCILGFRWFACSQIYILRCSIIRSWVFMLWLQRLVFFFISFASGTVKMENDINDSLKYLKNIWDSLFSVWFLMHITNVKVIKKNDSETYLNQKLYHVILYWAYKYPIHTWNVHKKDLWSIRWYASLVVFTGITQALKKSKKGIFLSQRDKLNVFPARG